MGYPSQNQISSMFEANIGTTWEKQCTYKDQGHDNVTPGQDIIKGAFSSRNNINKEDQVFTIVLWGKREDSSVGTTWNWF